MTLQEFSRDVVPLLQIVISFLGLASLYLVWWQIREARLWNKITTQASLTKVDEMHQLEKKLHDAYKAINVDLRHMQRPLTPVEVKSIRENESAGLATKAYLSDLEVLGAAVSLGAVDDDYARAVHAPRFEVAYMLFQPLIMMLRAEYNDPTLYIEIQKTALRWQERLLMDRAKTAKGISRIQTRLATQQAKIDILRSKVGQIGGTERQI